MDELSEQRSSEQLAERHSRRSLRYVVRHVLSHGLGRNLKSVGGRVNDCVWIQPQASRTNAKGGAGYSTAGRPRRPGGVSKSSATPSATQRSSYGSSRHYMAQAVIAELQRCLGEPHESTQTCVRPSVID